MADTLAGRNDPCPCGSGRRYKNCHGSLGAPRDTAGAGAPALAEQARASFSRGQREEAAAIARRVLGLDPNSVDGWNVLGLALEAEDPSAALAAWQRAAAIAPRDPEAHFRLGDYHRRRGTHDAAVAAYRAVLAIVPSHAVVHNNLGLALQEQQSLQEAEACFRTAVTLQPGLAEALANLADLCRRTDRYAEASGWFQQALEREPRRTELWVKLGICQYRLDMMTDARASFERARTLDPNDPGILVNLASVLLAQHQLGEASDVVAQALRLQPDLAEAQDLQLYVDQHICRWDDLERLFGEQRARLAVPEAPPVVPHNLLALPYTAAELLVASRKWVAHHVRPKPASPPPLRQLVDGRLRVGYLGSDFRTHPLASLLSEVIERHDRSRFEVFGYSFGPDDGSAARARFARAFDRFVDIRTEPFADTAQRIRDERIAVLFDTGGYTMYARSEIFALRPAPIQVNCIGFPGTLGADYMDYIVTDSFVTPPSEQPHFSERFILMPHCYLPGDTRRVIGPAPTRAQCSLPENAMVFCCFNASYKIHPGVFAVWMRLLARVPGSVLWLLDTGPIACANLRREALRAGVAPERIVFAPRMPLSEHLARHAVADLFLDTWPCNAHTTANDALFAGLPVLTCAGETFASRVGGSLLRAIGLPKLVTHDARDYEALALRLAEDRELRAGLRERLAAHRDRYPLFDTAGYTRALEDRLWTAWEEWLRAGAAAHG